MHLSAYRKAFAHDDTVFSLLIIPLPSDSDLKGPCAKNDVRIGSGLFWCTAQLHASSFYVYWMASTHVRGKKSWMQWKIADSHKEHNAFLWIREWLAPLTHMQQIPFTLQTFCSPFINEIIVIARQQSSIYTWATWMQLCVAHSHSRWQHYCWQHNSSDMGLIIYITVSP